MTKKIIGVLGLGIFGRTVAEELSKFEQDVIAVDCKENSVQDVAEFVSKAAVGDITDIEFLKAVGIAQCDKVVIATGTSLESSVLAIMHCKKLGVKTILAKAKNATYEEVLYGIGATKVITPERDSGKTVSSNMLRHRIDNIVHLEDTVSMIEFSIPDSWVGKNLIQLDLRNKYDLNLIGIRRKNLTTLDTDINPSEVFEPNTKVVAIASDNTFEKFDYLGYLK
ncbi:potassium uptake transporter gating subunit KtrA [Streptococcus alactolyticus]|jgi:trk system potassium uptake protein TrkA|uniref:Potassium uptake transporter gating subunit KtrA n=1 Tax=Streptococcus alactolyticus TaxID=29389 RepID=A0A6N7WNU5_STRAY|nr:MULTISPECIES: potassium uptake transporter gating subunit KtrA [Streptococcus]MDE2587209.1 TrkA family potassium uptake protein [Lactobacillales bacterium]MCF2666028.1 TrkA family potassium uptake protein [Streptococcus alactolyticus]MCF2678144.1 TrkA family potassium uptake protein [Streptococcus alactolyticus]MCI6904294.1 potassium uptake transporter gating subunit KtrA [Streptococcus alactolyticus]MDD7361465.1 potassium uptake transporter gating subunit KtrA [Streptococcus alactolyticus]